MILGDKPLIFEVVLSQVESKTVVPLLSPLVGEQCSPKGERTTVEPSHGGALIRTNYGVRRGGMR
jgi:hypothetical protein